MNAYTGIKEGRLIPSAFHYDKNTQVILTGSDLGVTNPVHILDGYEGYDMSIVAPDTTAQADYVLPAPIDVSNSNVLELVVHIDNVAAFSSVRVYLFTSANPSTVDHGLVTLRVEKDFGGGYYRLKIPLNLISTVGAYDPTNITWVRVRSYASDTVTISVISVKQMVNNPVITFNFDDSSPTVYSTAMPILSKYGFRGSFFVITDNIDKTDQVTSNQLKELYNLGWDIGSHTDTHVTLTTNTEDVVRSDVSKARQKLISLGFFRSANLLAAPGGNFSGAQKYLYENLVQFVRSSIHSTLRSMLPAKQKDSYPHAGFESHDGLLVADVKTRIDEVIANGEWFNLTHHIIDSAPGYTNPTDFEEIVSYIYQKTQETNLQVKTTSEVLMQTSIGNMIGESPTHLKAISNNELLFYPVIK